MNIIVKSLEEIMEVKSDKNAIIIRLFDKGFEPPLIMNEFKDIHSFWFDDLDYADDYDTEENLKNFMPNSILLFNEEIKENIINFVRNSKAESIYVHCHAGVSRSPAVALGLNRIFNYKETRKKKEKQLMSEKPHFNRYVFELFSNERFSCPDFYDSIPHRINHNLKLRGGK